METIKIQAEDSDDAYETSGLTNYQLDEVLSEFVDNSISASNGPQVAVTFKVYIDGETAMKIVIEDNGKGIAEEEIPKVIALGKKNPDGGAFNEHGMGLKQAAWFLGNKHTIETTKAGIPHILAFSPLKRETSLRYEPKPDSSISFTRITIDLNQEKRAVPVTEKATRTLIQYLGARYRWFLEPNKEGLKRLTLTYDMLQRSREDEPYTSVLFAVNPVKPIYFKGGNIEPYLYKRKVESPGKWAIELTAGLAPSNDYQWDQIGIPPELRAKKGQPYYICQANQGLDIMIKGRVLLFNQISEADVKIVDSRHNRFNLVRGEINLISGFKTQRTKNGVVAESNWKEMIQRVKTILTDQDPEFKIGRDLLGQSTDDDYTDVDEEIYHKRVADILKTIKMMNPAKADVKVLQQVGEGFDLIADIIVGDDIWEIKKAASPPIDVMQLAMYLTITGKKKGFLVSESFNESAKALIPLLKSKYDLEITLYTHKDLNINRPTTIDETRWQEAGGLNRNYTPTPSFT